MAPSQNASTPDRSPQPGTSDQQQYHDTSNQPQRRQADGLPSSVGATTSAPLLPRSSGSNVSPPGSKSRELEVRLRPPLGQTTWNHTVLEETSHSKKDEMRYPSELAESFRAKSMKGDSTPRPPSARSNDSRHLPSRPTLKSAQSSYLSAPKSVRDLGSDFTRYYNPFMAIKTSDGGLKSTSPACSLSRLLRTTAVSSPDLERRLIEPLSCPKMMITTDGTVDEHVMPTLHAKNSYLDLRTWVSTSPEDRSRVTEYEVSIQDTDPVFDSCPPYVDDRLNAPSTLPLFTDEKEDDDEMHLPRWDDDIKHKAHWRDHWSFTNIINGIGGILVVLGLSCVFVALPVISLTGIDTVEGQPPSRPWTYVNENLYPLLQNVRTGLIDPDTPENVMTRASVGGEGLVLVFSDEFNEKNRTFYPGDDPYWFAPDIWYGATQDLEWYDPDAINTGEGTLQIQLDEFANHGLDYRSGMLNSWNQVCFKGGVFEVSISLPGPAGVHGLWPGIWTMGNLGRPGYLSTTDGLWPYTYNNCDVGITPNQSSTDGISHLPGQRLPSCSCAGADHPTPGTGRGAPEIDIAEVSADYGGMGLSVATQSYQVAPFDIWYYPNYEFMETPGYNISFVNTYTGGPYQQAVSTTSMLNNNWYDGKEYQKFAYEYTPGNGADASITWFIGDEETMRFDARAIGPNGNSGQRLVSEEPMSMIINLGFSHSWTYVEFEALKFPTVLQVDYVRWYQPRDAQIVTCDPPGYETTEYIARHPEAYNNPNHTFWRDAGYDWPENILMHGCSA